jgi:LysR family transcriptional regulator, glycine cleavage system transcriptional activator
MKVVYLRPSMNVPKVAESTPIPRRLVPSLSLLMAFEAAARTGSVTAAAKEVHITQGAVSRQIKVLEARLGVPLFVRERQTIRLTLAGESYAREIRDALRQISSASLNLRANPGGGTLNLAVPPGFSERWLAPRLLQFTSAYPRVRINVRTREQHIDSRLDPMDAAIDFGTDMRQGLCACPLRRQVVLPMCSPGVKKACGFGKVDDLLKASLLHLTWRADAWEQWMRRNGVERDILQGMLFDNFATMAQAAVAGVGVALLPTFLFKAELDAGALVPALNVPSESLERYFLIWPPDLSSYPPFVNFREWLLAALPQDRDTF